MRIRKQKKIIRNAYTSLSLETLFNITEQKCT